MMSNIIHLVCARCNMKDMVSEDLYKEWALACPAKWCGGVYVKDVQRMEELSTHMMYIK